MDKENNQNIFFIRGYIRSGTNWLNNLLNLHPDIHGDGEFNFIPIRRGMEFVRNREWGLLSKVENKDLSDILVKNFEEMVKNTISESIYKKTKENYSWIGDRSPNPLLPLPIENAHYFWIIRDIRDVLISSTFHELASSHTETTFNAFPKMKEKKGVFDQNENYFSVHPYELLDDEDWVMHIANNWSNQTKLNISLIEQVKNNNHPAKIKVIRYEDLHQDIERERRDMYEFLNLDPYKANPIDDLSSPGFKKEKPKNHYRKGKVGSWKKYIDDDTQKIIKDITQEEMEYFDYSF